MKGKSCTYSVLVKVQDVSPAESVNQRSSTTVDSSGKSQLLKGKSKKNNVTINLNFLYLNFLPYNFIPKG